MYVIEGSTLRGKIITKKLRNSLVLENEEELGFFNAYGDETGKYWTDFLQILNSTDQDYEDIRQGAFSAFQFLEECLIYTQEKI